MRDPKNFIRLGAALLISLVLFCAEENPPRDEIPAIKDLLARFEEAVREHNPILMDSLIMAEAYDSGYNSPRILSEIYSDSTNGSSYTFGRRSFSYTKDKAVVNCFIKADSADSGRPVEIILVKSGDQWLVKRFDFK